MTDRPDLPTDGESTIGAIKLNAGLLAVCALITAWLLGLTYSSTGPRIRAAERLVEQRSLLEVVESLRHDNQILDETLPIPAQYQALLNTEDGAEINVVRNGDRVVGFIVPAIAPDGYSGAIRLIVGLDIEGSITGLRITQHSETPGLGDKVELRKSDWVLSFIGKSIQNPVLDQWKVKKDGGQFDGFTGATITPRAVVHEVANVLRYYRDDKVRLIESARRSYIDSDG